MNMVAMTKKVNYIILDDFNFNGDQPKKKEVKKVHKKFKRFLKAKVPPRGVIKITSRYLQDFERVWNIKSTSSVGFPHTMSGVTHKRKKK